MVREVDRGYLLYQVAQASSRVMVGFQTRQRELLLQGGSSLGEQPLEQLAAVVNNNVRCYDLASDFYDTLEEALSDGYHVRTPSDRAPRVPGFNSASGERERVRERERVESSSASPPHRPSEKKARPRLTLGIHLILTFLIRLSV